MLRSGDKRDAGEDDRLRMDAVRHRAAQLRLRSAARHAEESADQGGEEGWEIVAF